MTYFFYRCRTYCITARVRDRGNYICLSRMEFVTFGITLEFNLAIPHENMILELNIYIYVTRSSL